jgi:hypothetical protein
LWYLRCHGKVGEEASSSSKQNIALKCNGHKMIKENGKKKPSQAQTQVKKGDEDEDDGEEEKEDQDEASDRPPPMKMKMKMKMKKIWNLYLV